MNYNKSFLITLGHNSSVIYYNGENKRIGYEEERLTKVKSDSAYPKNALEKVLSLLTNEEKANSNVFISHWFDHFELEKFPPKYFDLEHFNSLVEKHQLCVIPLSPTFTHHDAHAYSALSFHDDKVEDKHRIIQANVTNGTGELFHIVADGFGNNQEVLSIYKGGNELDLVKRVYGYESSLGLLYQYATSYCGMKENQDEYKFLGYEVRIEELLDYDAIEMLNIEAYNFSMDWFKANIHISTEKPAAVLGQAINLDKLKQLKDNHYSLFDHIYTKYIETTFENKDEKRILIGYFVQRCLEQVLLRIISKYNIKNVVLSGGCFLNVKLNKLILDALPGTVCINPLAGDQGAAIGLYRKYTKHTFPFGDLCYGIRDKFDVAQATVDQFVEQDVYIFNDKMDFRSKVSELLSQDKIVNIMQGNMEFGPRALCNTSTLAKPTAENTKYINAVNNRNEVMPMAPVIAYNRTQDILRSSDLNRVVGSNKFMIITHEYVDNMHRKHRGVLHNSLNGGFTCRPQIVDMLEDNNMLAILFSVEDKMLINTSFNTHGTPILYSFEDGVNDFRKQKKLDVYNRLTLVILNNG